MKSSTLIFLSLLCVGLALAKKEGNKRMKNEKFEGKREAAIHSYPPRSSHLMHVQPVGGALSVGAGYSFSGSKTPSFSYSTPSFGSSHGHAFGNSIGSHGFGQGYYSPVAYTSVQPPKIRYTSISSLLNSGQKGGSGLNNVLSSTVPQSFGASHHVSRPQISYGTPHYASIGKPETSYATPMTYTIPAGSLSHHSSSRPHVSSLPSYAAGTHGLGAYATSDSPVFSGPLFMPASSHETGSVMYAVPSGQLGHFSFSGSDNSVEKSPFAFSNKGKLAAGYIGGASKGQLISGLTYGPEGTEFKPSLYLGSSGPSQSGSHLSPTYVHSSPVPTYSTPTTSHSSVFAGSPIYVSPKALGESSHAQAYEVASSAPTEHQSNVFHGSTSMTGSYEIPSAGHAASSLNFGGSSGLYHGVPSFNHETSNLIAESHSSVYPAELHTAYSGPAASHGANHFSAQPSSYVSPANFGYSNLDNSFNGAKHKLTSLTSDDNGFSSSFEHGKTSEKLYSHPKASYSTRSNAYASPPESFRSSEVKYDTIKYSHDFGTDQM